MTKFTMSIAAVATAMIIGGGVSAMTENSPRTPADRASEVANPMIGGQAMLTSRDAIENLSNSPEHTTLMAALKQSDLGTALRSNGEFTVFAPTDAAFAATSTAHDEKALSYLVVPGKYDSQHLLRAINEAGGRAKLKTLEGGTLIAEMNGPTNIVLIDEKGATANIAIYDVYDRNGVVQVIDHVLRPAVAAPAQVAGL